MNKAYLILLLFIVACNQPAADKAESQTAEKTVVIDKEAQDAIIEEYLKNGAHNHHYYAKEWGAEIDKGLAKDSTIAYLWQQKAMPLFKQGKHELAMPYLNNAVKYDPDEWLDYRAFMKCIFARAYTDAIVDFEASKIRFGYDYVMDHTFDFYIGLCNLQLNKFEKAEAIFATDITLQEKKYDAETINPLDYFYWGICNYELQEYEKAIPIFDKALKLYPDFADVQYYKSLSLGRLDKKEEANALFQLARINGEKGYTINEDNVVYEHYPYQIRW